MTKHLFALTTVHLKSEWNEKDYVPGINYRPMYLDHPYRNQHYKLQIA